MSAQRISKFNRVVDELAGLVTQAEALTAWPGFLQVKGAMADLSVSLHVSTVSPHARGDHEFRFQNPANSPPVSDLHGKGHPILLATDISDGATVFVAIDGLSRLGRQTRFSILFNRRILSEAREFGWSVYESTRGEKIYAFLPMLFPAFLEQIKSGELLTTTEVSQVATSSGAIDGEGVAAANRASRAVNILIRKSGAGKSIRKAYKNSCCMCGIASSLVVGAHIFPVEAPGSTDNVWNGLSLCHNHHAAFDLHLIWIDPVSGGVLIHPELQEAARTNSGANHFINSTHPRLVAPFDSRNGPRPEMLKKRYAYFAGKYAWASIPRQ